MTCFGLNNQGELVFGYSEEDCDQVGNATVYNGQNSTLWLNFKEVYADQIKETYQQLRSDGKITYDMLEDRFITQGSDKWSESVYNEDSEFKYISMLRSDNDASNLVQLRGSGEEHFRYFIQNRLNYCDSKWYAPDYADDYVSLRIYTPVDAAGVPLADLAVPACADITVTPYSDMYTGVRYKANGTLYQERSTHGVPVTFEAPNEIFNNTETAIYGASQLSSLGDLSPLYCGSVKAANATKLTELIVGSGVEGYSNENLWELAVGTNKLLKKLDVRNCPKLESPLALTGCPNIEEVYATGTSITGIDLVDGGILRIAQLPATVTNLTLKNQHYIEEFTLAGYGNIKTLHIENCPAIDTWNLIHSSPALERLRLTGVNWTFDTAAELLALDERNLRGVNEYGFNIDSAHISGQVHIKTLTGSEFSQLKVAFPYLDISYDTLESQLVFMTWDGSEELYRMTIVNGGNGVDPVVTGMITAPSRESTDQYDFTHAGWSKTKDSDESGITDNVLKNVEADRYVYAAYTKTVRYYNVHFYSGTTKLETQSTAYGSTAYYSGSEPVKTGVTNPEDYEFIGWSPAPTNITGELTCYAQFEFLGSWARELLKRTLEGEYVNDRVTSVGVYAFCNVPITKLDLPKCETIEEYAFNSMQSLISLSAENYVGSPSQKICQNCKKLESVYFPKCTEVGPYAFQGCANLNNLELSPDLVKVGSGAFGGIAIERFIYPKAQITLQCFSGCSYLKKVDIDGFVMVNTNSAFANTTSLETLIIRNDAQIQKISTVATFTGSTIESGTGFVYVPRILVDLYKADSIWSNFASQIRAIEDYPEICGGE